MESTTPSNFFALSAPPVNAASPLPFEIASRVPSERSVFDSPEPQRQHASFQDLNGESALSVMTTSSRQRRVREREAVQLENGSDQDTKISKTPGSRLTRTAHGNHGQSSASVGMGFIYGSASFATQLAYPSGLSFAVTPQELAQLRAASDRPLIETGSSSDGKLLAHFTASAAVPLAAPGHASEQAVNQGAPAPAPVADEHAQAAPQASFDPVNSKFAKTLRSKLRKALKDGVGYKNISSELLRPSAGDYRQLREKRSAFTPEFLVTVLKVLPDLESNPITTLGKAVGCLGVPEKTPGYRGSKGMMTGSLGGKARSVIGEALAHEAVQSRVSLDALIDFLSGADQTEPRPEKNRKFPRRRFSGNGMDYGIPQALGKRLGREAQDASPAMRDSVRATTARLCLMLDKDRNKDRTLTAVNEGIDASSASAGVKTWLKDEFKTRFLLPPPASDGEELSADERS